MENCNFIGKITNISIFEHLPHVGPSVMLVSFVSKFWYLDIHPFIHWDAS